MVCSDIEVERAESIHSGVVDDNDHSFFQNCQSIDILSILSVSIRSDPIAKKVSCDAHMSILSRSLFLVLQCLCDRNRMFVIGIGCAASQLRGRDCSATVGRSIAFGPAVASGLSERGRSLLL